MDLRQRITELEARLKQVEISEQNLKQEIEILGELSAIIGRAHNLESAVKLILEGARKVIPYDMASLQLLKGNELQVIGGSGYQNESEVKKLRFPYPFEGSLSTYALNSGLPVLSKDVEKKFPSFVQPPGEKRILSWMGIPLIHYNEKIGLIALDSFRKNGFNDHHLKLAELISSPLAIALENAQIHENLFHMAMEDPLTHIGNRYRFDIEGRMLFEAASRKQQELAVVMLDIDHFKTINDTYGHQVGDEVLQRFAACCSAEMRVTDLISRIGGDEFIFLFNDTGAKAAEEVMGRMRETWEGVSHPGIREPITLSAGICAMVPDAYTTLDTMVYHADTALYASKQAGRNRISLYREEIRTIG